jgi:hypothetical protein
MSMADDIILDHLRRAYDAATNEKAWETRVTLSYLIRWMEERRPPWKSRP